MTRKEMDQLNVGDKVEVKTYNTTTEEYEWIPAIVSQVLVCSGRTEIKTAIESKFNGR